MVAVSLKKKKKKKKKYDEKEERRSTKYGEGGLGRGVVLVFCFFKQKTAYEM